MSLDFVTYMYCFNCLENNFTPASFLYFRPTSFSSFCTNIRTIFPSLVQPSLIAHPSHIFIWYNIPNENMWRVSNEGGWNYMSLIYYLLPPHPYPAPWGGWLWWFLQLNSNIYFSRTRKVLAIAYSCTLYRNRGEMVNKGLLLKQHLHEP